MKYKLTDETKEVGEHLLHRIEALKDFNNVHKGDRGGWIEEESNLSHNGNAWVYGNAKVSGDAEVSGDAKICRLDDYCVIKNFWSSGRYFTYTRSNNLWKVGCFYGTSEELIKKAYEDSEEKGKCYEATVKYVESIMGIIGK